MHNRSGETKVTKVSNKKKFLPESSSQSWRQSKQSVLKKVSEVQKYMECILSTL